MTLRATALALLVTGCATMTPSSTIPMPASGFQLGDRVLIGDFSRVTAIASTTDRVYVVYPAAVVVWHPLERRWDVPSAPGNSDQLRTVTAAAVDPLDHSLWLSTAGPWLHFDPFSNAWDVSPLPPPRPLTRPVTVDDAMRDLPQLRALAPHIATGPLLVQGVLTAAAPDPLGAGWYLGTSTRGLVFFSRIGTDATPIPLGLSGDIVGAVAAGDAEVRVATDADVQRPAAVTVLAADLSHSAAIADLPVRGLPFDAVRRIIVSANGTWLATDKGVVHVSPTDQRLERFDASRGLPDERVHTVVEYRGGIVAGTERGVAMLHGDSAFVRNWPGYIEPVYALLARSDTLWVGTARGLFAAVPGSNELRMPAGFELLLGERVPILGIGYVSDTLVAMTQDRLVWRDPASGGWTEGPVLSGEFGSLAALDVTANGAWVGGPRGAGFVQPNSTALRLLMVPAQLPDAVTAISQHGSYLWVGTRSGLVRFLLEGP